jgi:fumarate hydratase subunit beta
MPLEALGDGRARISAPLTDEDVRHLHTGEVALVSGTVVAARDTAHRRFAELLEAGEDLPFDPRGAILYYAGPTPARPGNVVGAIGPTTASRLDRFTPALLEAGVKCLVGKGGRGPEVREALRSHAFTILVDVDLDDAWQRVRDSGRPLGGGRPAMGAPLGAPGPH